MKKTINMQHEANIQAEGELSGRKCKSVICLETGEVFSSITDAAEKENLHPAGLSACLVGKQRTFGGKHWCYLSRVNESLDAIVTRLREANADVEAAQKWRAYEAEQEAKRIAEQKRQDAIAKAKEKVERAQGIHDTLAAKYREALNTLAQAQRELAALENEEV